MARLTTSQEQLQVAQPSRFIANRQVNDLSGFGQALGGAVQSYAGVARVRRAEEDARLELASSSQAQKLILQSEEAYVEGRNRAIAEGKWNQETALQLKNQSRMGLRRNLINAGVVDKNLVAHAEDQVSKIFVDGEWGVNDKVSPFVKQVTSPNGQVSFIQKSKGEVGAAFIQDMKEINPELAKMYAIPAMGGTVTDKSGNIIINQDMALEMLDATMTTHYKHEEAKRNWEQSQKISESIIPSATNMFRADARAIAMNLAVNTDFTQTNKDQFRLKYKNQLVRSLNAEAYNTFPKFTEQGENVNALVKSNLIGQIDDVATSVADEVYAANVGGGKIYESARNMKALIDVSATYGVQAVTGSDTYKDLVRSIRQQTTGSMMDKMFGAMSGGGTFDMTSLDPNVEKQIISGKKLESVEQAMFYILHNEKTLTDIEANEAVLRTASPKSTTFKDAVNQMTVHLDKYVKSVAEQNDPVFSPRTAYYTASMLINNPKIDEFLETMEPGRRESFIKALGQTKRQAAQQIDEVDPSLLKQMDKLVAQSASQSFSKKE